MVSPLGSPRASLALERARAGLQSARDSAALPDDVAEDLEELADELRSEAADQGDDLPAASSPGERITRRFFDLCESPRTRERMMRTVRASAHSAVGGRMLVALLSRTLFLPLLRARRIDDAAASYELVAAQLGGIAVLRYVTRMEPVASMPVDELVNMVAPGIQATLVARRAR